MKKTQILMTVLPLLIATMIFSVGFSTWTLAAPTAISAETSFSATTDPIFSVGDMLSIQKIDTFNYSSLHFVDASGAPSDTGSLVLTCEIDVDACREAMGDSWTGSLTVRIDLLYSNLALEEGESYDLFAPLSGEFQKSVSANLLVGNSSTPSAISNHGSYVYTTVTVSPGIDAVGPYSFGVEFLFNIPMNKPGTDIPANFRQTFGKYLKVKLNDKTDFVATARIITD